MVIDPGWQDRIWCYRYHGEWMTVEAVTDGRAKGLRELVLANPYTFAALCRRYMDGRDVPVWVVKHIEKELGLEPAA